LAQRKHWNPARQSFHYGGFLLAATFGSMSADQHMQIGILRVATSFIMKTSFIKHSENFEKS
jgi:hypothetical protein